jgi:hypothetical protein
MRRFLLGWLAGAISMILWRAHLDGQESDNPPPEDTDGPLP